MNAARKAAGETTRPRKRPRPCKRGTAATPPALPAAVYAARAKPALLKRLEVRLVKAVWRLQRGRARRLGCEGTLHGGGVCFWPWFGSSLQLTPHLHLLLPEAQWQGDGEVVPLPPPSNEEVAAVLARVLRQAKKDWAELHAAWAEDEYEEGTPAARHPGAAG